MPRKIKMRREREGGFMEDYFDYIFPDDEKKMGMPTLFDMWLLYLEFLTLFFNTVGLKILEKAMAWKKLTGALPISNPNAEELSIDDDSEAVAEVDGHEDVGEADAEEESTLGKRKGAF